LGGQSLSQLRCQLPLHKGALKTAVGENAQGSLWEPPWAQTHKGALGTAVGGNTQGSLKKLSSRLQRFRCQKPPLCKGRCPAGAEGLSFTCAVSALSDKAKGCGRFYNPSVSFAASSRLEGEHSEPEGAAKFILRPGTPARRSRGWGENAQGSLENRRGRKLEGERSEPEGAAKFILRPETPARRSRGWGEKYKGAFGNRRE
jgi:hypothetical protein